MCTHRLSTGNASAMPAGVARRSWPRGQCWWAQLGSALTPLRGAPLLLSKGINFPVTLGRVWPPLFSLPHGASRLLCPPCRQPIPIPSHPRGAAGSWGSQTLPSPPSPPALPRLYLDNFFTCSIYEDSPPSANTLSFLLLCSGSSISLFFIHLIFLPPPLPGPTLGSPFPRQAGRQRVLARASLCLATEADGESGRGWDVQRFCLPLPRLGPQLSH